MPAGPHRSGRTLPARSGRTSHFSASARPRLAHAVEVFWPRQRRFFQRFRRGLLPSNGDGARRHLPAGSVRGRTAGPGRLASHCRVQVQMACARGLGGPSTRALLVRRRSSRAYRSRRVGYASRGGAIPAPSRRDGAHQLGSLRASPRWIAKVLPSARATSRGLHSRAAAGRRAPRITATSLIGSTACCGPYRLSARTSASREPCPRERGACRPNRWRCHPPHFPGEFQSTLPGMIPRPSYNHCVAFITDIMTPDGRRLAELVTTFHKYVLPDSTEMFVYTTPAWCRECGRFVLAEKLGDPDEMEASAREYYRRRGGDPGVALDELSQELEKSVYASVYVKFMRDAAQWRTALESRASPPRCLTCGGSDFIAIPEGGSWFEHPDIPTGPVKASTTCHACMGSSGERYDTEGRRIAIR
jgi:hypothetical protein